MKTTKFLILALIICSFQISAQTKRPAPKTTPIIQIEATTIDGKTVILSSDGTWQYDQNKPAQKNQTTAKTLNIEAAVVYKVGDVVPVSRTQFYLLKQNTDTLIFNDEMVDGCRQELKKYYQSMPNFESMYGKDSILLKKELIQNILSPTVCPDYSTKSRQILDVSSEYKAMSDFSGKVSFNDLRDGKYYIFAVSSTRKGVIAWNIPIVIKAKDENLILDQNNAFYAR